MIPCELKKDRNGILYTDDNTNLYQRLINFGNHDIKNEFYQSSFYRLKSSNDYIIKRPVTLLTRKERIIYMNMLVSLIKLQDKVTHTDFPIAYYKEKRKLAGLVIKYYQNGLSIDQLSKEKDLNLLKKYYSHSEDNIHNLFMLFDEYLDCLYELYQNGIYYIDIHKGNIILNNNEVKIIDFDPDRIIINRIDNRIREAIFSRYITTIGSILNEYSLVDEDILVELNLSKYCVDDFYAAKHLNKKLEDIMHRK